MADTPVCVDPRGEVGAALARVLSSGVAAHRCLAAKALGRVGDADGIDALIQALLDEDEDVRTDAAAALAGIADGRAKPALMESLLGDPCPEVKLAAIEALVRLEHPEIGALLRRLARGRDEAIQLDDTDFYESGWDDWLDLQLAAVKALGGLRDGDAVDDIRAALDEEFGQDLTEAGFAALAGLGAPGAGALDWYLQSADLRQRRRAAAALAGMSADDAAAGLARAFADLAAEVRLAVLEALAEIPEDGRMAALLADPAAEVRALVMRRWGRARPDLALRLLDDEAPSVGVAALEAIGGTTASVEEVEATAAARRLLDGPPLVAAAAARALARLAPEDAADDLARLAGDPDAALEARLGALEALASVGGEAALSVARDFAVDPERQLRLAALSALLVLAKRDGERPSASVEQLLLLLSPAPSEPPVAEVGDADVASDEAVEQVVDEAQAPPAEKVFPKTTLAAIMAGDMVAEALVASETEDVPLTADDLDYLALARSTPKKKRVSLTPEMAADDDAKRFAARLLGDLPRADVALALAEELASDDGELRLVVADSLARIAAALPSLPAPVRARLRELLTESERDLRLFAARALGASDDRDALAALRERLDDDDSFVRIEAVGALAAMEETGPEVRALLDDPDPGARSAAARAVAASSDAVDDLVAFAFAFEGFHCREAGRLLTQINAPEAAKRFLEVLGDREKIRTWPVAIEALEELYARTPTTGGNQIEENGIS